MKRLLIVLLPILVVTLLLPKEVKAVTLKEYEDAVVKYTKELEEKEAKIARGKEETTRRNRKKSKGNRKER